MTRGLVGVQQAGGERPDSHFLTPHDTEKGQALTLEYGGLYMEINLLTGNCFVFLRMFLLNIFCHNKNKMNLSNNVVYCVYV